MYGNHERPANPAPARRKPLAPLPEQLGGPLRAFVSALRETHEEVGLTLSDLESRLPASRSSLSRYLRGQSLPDEKLLAQWCALSPAGEKRRVELTRLLYLAEAHAEANAGANTMAHAEANAEAGAGAGAEVSGPQGSEQTVDLTPGRSPAGGDAGRTEPTGAAPHRLRQHRLLVPALFLALLLAGGAVALVLALTGKLGGSEERQDAKARTERLRVNNVDPDCAGLRTRNCALGMALDPYAAYRPSNIGGRIWHDDRLTADCRVADGVTVTDESGGHSSIWFRVRHQDRTLWLPGIRIDANQLQYSSLPNCP